MVLVDIDEKIHESVKRYVETFPMDYPSMKNFLDKTIREKLIQLGFDFKLENNKK